MMSPRKPADEKKRFPGTKLYYEVLVARSFGQRGGKLLTYHSTDQLARGQIITVPYGATTSLGVIWAKVKQPPDFATKALSRVLPLPVLPATYISLLEWLSAYYATSLGLVLRAALAPRLASLPENFQAITTGTQAAPVRLPALTADQRRVLKAIQAAPNTAQWLHAETGSGKTRIYMELARKCLAAGQDALILVPEISLSSQTREQFETMFGEQVSWLHSRLADSARRALWCQALTADRPARVWLGTRSSLFLPLSQVGLIVIDESHDGSYKQDSVPRYHAAHVASRLAQLHGARLILGSATPSVNDIYLAERKQLPIHHIDQPIKGQTPTKLEVVDMRQYRPNWSQTRWLSPPLESALQATLRRGEQAIIFLNRRGSASLILCSHCGWQALCAYCHLPQTYHSDSHQRVCHACNRRETMFSSCPNCGEPELLLRGCGTKELERLLGNRFPSAQVLRLDQDSARPGQFDATYHAMHSGRVDIIVGTQMIAKGFDLPRVTMIGVVHADAALSLPDFAASERTFQLLYQVVGRGGRHRPRNHVVIQTYRPDHPAIRFALARDWHGFYAQELAARRQTGFPPHNFLLQISCRRPTAGAAQRTLATIAKNVPAGVRVLGPSPAFHGRSGQQHIWQLACLAKQRSALIDIVNRLPSDCQADLDPDDLL